VVVVVAIVLGLSGIFSGTKTTDSGAEIPKDPKEAAKTVATNYLTAISEGRAEDAKKFLKYQSDDATLLTDDVLKDSLTRAPITEITVGEPTGSSTSLTVSVTYKVGSESASDEYRVDTDGGTISTTLPTLYLNRFKGVDLTVNGATVKPQESKSNAVFPGSYTVASANKYLEVTGDTTIIRTSGTDSKSPNLELGVSQAGIELFREKVLPEAKACLESKALSPGCGITMSGELRGGETLQDGTVNRTQNAEAQSKMENVVPKVGTSVPTIISSSDFGNFEISGICTVGDRQGQCEIMAFGRSTRWGTASINVAEEDPKVQWDS
jgi:hypothetical protein